MDLDRARRLVSDAPVGRLATITRDGRPHLVPCCFVLVDQVIYTAVDAKPKSTVALRRIDNIRANSWASLLVDHYQDNWSDLWWVRVDGHARLCDSANEQEVALAALSSKYAQYRDVAIPGPVIAIDVDSWRTWP